MEDIFINILNMSITASYCVIAVVLIRLILKKFPKIYSYILWVAVFFRMICPVSIKSVFSFLKPYMIFMSDTSDTDKVVSYVDYNFNAINDSVNNTSGTNHTMADINISDRVNAALDRTNSSSNTALSGGDPMQTLLTIVAIIWGVVVLGLVIYSVISALRLKRKLKSCVHIEANIYETKEINTPFVFGVLKPKIYLPSFLSEDERNFVLKHELTHIRRKDYIIKPVAFFIVCVHWFNPFAWLAFYLMSRDMEMSCDESAVKKLSRDETADYSWTLLAMASDKRLSYITPLAFSEGKAVKGRIKNVLNYKRPVVWVTGIIIAVLAIVIIGLSLNPKDSNVTKVNETEGETINAEDLKTPEEAISDYYNELPKSYRITNVEAAKVLETVEIDFDFAKENFLEYEYNNDTETKAYLIGVDYDAFEEHWICMDGVDYDVVSLILSNRGWRVKERVTTRNKIVLFDGEEYELSEEYVAAAKEKYKYYYYKPYQNTEKTKLLTMDDVIEMSKGSTYKEYNFNEYINGELSEFWNDVDSDYTLNFGLDYNGARYTISTRYMIYVYGMGLTSVSISGEHYPYSFYLYHEMYEGKKMPPISAMLDGYDFEEDVSYELPEGLTGILYEYYDKTGLELSDASTGKVVGSISPFLVDESVSWNGDNIRGVGYAGDDSYSNSAEIYDGESVEGFSSAAYVDRLVIDNYSHSGIDYEELDKLNDEERYDTWWRVHLARQGENFGYTVKLNTKEFTKEDAINLAKTLKF